MGDQGFIAAVRLSDKEEVDQPDPLVLSSEEVKGITWRHFETLLKSMYTQTPETIQVKYLDDENDWVEMSSDAELSEALKYTKDSGEIMQLLVKSTSPITGSVNLVDVDGGDHSEEEYQMAPSTFEQTSTQIPVYVPTTDPGGDVLQPLVYPYPDVGSSKDSQAQKISQPPQLMPVLQPIQASCPAAPPADHQQQSNTMAAGLISPSCQAPRLVYPHPPASTTTPANASLGWTQASSLDPKEKVEFLKHIAHQSRTNSLNTQDPFEMVPNFACGISSEKTPSSILTPTQATLLQSKKEETAIPSAPLTQRGAQSVTTEIQPPPPATRPKVSYRSAVVPKAKLQKKLSEPGASVPIPRNVMMMEGAQSGANAVAIEMPFEPDCRDDIVVTREKEIAASGSTPSQSVFEGECEGVFRSGAQASSVGKEGAQTVELVETDGVSTLKQVKKEVKRCLKKEQAQERKEGQSKQSEVAKDGEGSEGKEGSAVCYKDFVKHIRKLKKDIHTSIVKDVTKQTDHLLKKRLTRSLSHSSGAEVNTALKDQGSVIHRGITCDHCDLKIVGVRYKCGNCEDFDLCEQCENSWSGHDPTHVFLKLRQPAVKAGCVGLTRLPLLRENIYEAEKRWEEEKSKVSKAATAEKEKPKKKKKDKDGKKKEAKKDKKKSKKGEGSAVATVSVAESQDQEERFQRLLTTCVDRTPSVAEESSKEEACSDELQRLREWSSAEEAPVEQKTVEEDKLDDATKLEEVEETLAPVTRGRVNSQSSTGSSIVQLSMDTEPAQQLLVSEPNLVDVEPLQEPLQTSNLNKEAEREEIEADGHVDRTAVTSFEDQCPMIALVPAQVADVPVSTKPCDETEDFSASSSYAGFESDSSEDFCVIDHPDDEEYEEIEEEIEDAEEEEEEEEEASRDAEVDEAEEVDEKADEPSAVGSEEAQDCSSDCPVPSAPEAACETPAAVEPRVYKHLVHQMNEEEKYHFQELLKAEMERDADEVKKLACKAEMQQHLELKQSLEQEMKRHEQAASSEGKTATSQTNQPAGSLPAADAVPETSVKGPVCDKTGSGKKAVREVRDAEYNEILEVKTMQAVLENTRLEDAALEAEARRVLDQEDEETKRQRELDPSYYRLQVTNRRVGQMLELEVQKFAALNSGDRTSLVTVERALQKLDWQQKLDEKKLELVERDIKQKQEGGQLAGVPGGPLLSRQTSSASTQCDANSVNSDLSVSSAAALAQGGTTEMRDADCQTLSEPGKPGSHLIQNVATGMSKAASTAFSTAKDVFYSLQAKQNEWKSSKPAKWMPGGNTYVPPTSTWTPPEDTYVLPKDDYVPPRDEYVPPTSTWTPPREMLEPSQENQSPEDGNRQEQDNGTNSHSADAAARDVSETSVDGETRADAGLTQSPFVSLEVADSALRREIQGMQRLIEMGFANREQNKVLLDKFNGDLERVVQELLQEEGGDHWAAHRH